MEDENAKRRKALRRHYNDTVRELATFVRKRDKRVLVHTVSAPGLRPAIVPLAIAALILAVWFA